MYIVQMKRPAALRIDTASNTPVYRQIVDGIRSQLVEGTLAPGDALPTVRDLALDLGVHFNTVAEAYRLLSGEGWLDVRRRRGAIVMARDTPQASPKARQNFAEKLRQLIAQMRSEGLTRHVLSAEMDALSAELRNEGQTTSANSMTTTKGKSC